VQASIKKRSEDLLLYTLVSPDGDDMSLKKLVVISHQYYLDPLNIGLLIQTCPFLIS